MTVQQIAFPVIKVSQPIGEFFIGRISAKDLVRISYSDVRRIEGEQRDVEKYLGIQRPLDKSRVKKIKQYIQSPDASFPTGIVLAVDQHCAEYDESGMMILKPFDSEFPETLIPLDKVAKVLDGQHRIAAFMTEQGIFDFDMSDISNTFQFNVVIFIGLDIDEQANIFATVNLAQTKVNKSLVYDLEGLSKTRSPFRTCHQIAVALDNADTRSPLYHRIKRLGVKTNGRDTAEPLTQAVFVESLINLISPDPFADRNLYMKGKTPKRANELEIIKYPFRNLFIDERDNEIALILFNYFSSIKTQWPTAWESKDIEGNILPRSNAFKAFMRYLKVIYVQIAGKDIGIIPPITEFLKYFERLSIKDADFTTGNFSPGSGGESAFYKLLIGEKTIKDLKN